MYFIDQYDITTKIHLIYIEDECDENNIFNHFKLAYQ